MGCSPPQSRVHRQGELRPDAGCGYALRSGSSSLLTSLPWVPIASSRSCALRSVVSILSERGSGVFATVGRVAIKGLGSKSTRPRREADAGVMLRRLPGEQRTGSVGHATRGHHPQRSGRLSRWLGFSAGQIDFRRYVTLLSNGRPRDACSSPSLGLTSSSASAGALPRRHTKQATRRATSLMSSKSLTDPYRFCRVKTWRPHNHLVITCSKRRS